MTAIRPNVQTVATDTALAGLCALLLLSLTSGCIRPRADIREQCYTIDRGRLPAPNADLDVMHLGPCIDTKERSFNIDTNSPMTILVHGCFGSAGKFRALAEVFAFHGQQTVCFSYDDRRDLTESAVQLREAIGQLSTSMASRDITVIGHSLGGLVSRCALTTGLEPDLGNLNIRLVTISAPYSGIYASSHCGSKAAMALTLGMAYPLCRYISGEKWHQITPASDFINEPGALIPQVKEHLIIVTDERDTCRRKDNSGECLESDYVFCLEEQYNDLVMDTACATTLEVKAGHVGIVGDNQQVPNTLISLLQEVGVMNVTASDAQERFKRLLSTLY